MLFITIFLLPLVAPLMSASVISVDVDNGTCCYHLPTYWSFCLNAECNIHFCPMSTGQSSACIEECFVKPLFLTLE